MNRIAVVVLLMGLLSACGSQDVADAASPSVTTTQAPASDSGHVAGSGPTVKDVWGGWTDLDTTIAASVMEKMDVAGIRPGMLERAAFQLLIEDGWDGDRRLLKDRIPTGELDVKARKASSYGGFDQYWSKGYPWVKGDKSLTIFAYEGGDGESVVWAVQFEQKFQDGQSLDVWQARLIQRYGQPTGSDRSDNSFKMNWRTKMIYPALGGDNCYRHRTGRPGPHPLYCEWFTHEKNRLAYQKGTQALSLTAEMSDYSRRLEISLADRRALTEATIRGRAAYEAEQARLAAEEDQDKRANSSNTQVEF